jgi:hypothetical protein
VARVATKATRIAKKMANEKAVKERAMETHLGMQKIRRTAYSPKALRRIQKEAAEARTKRPTRVLVMVGTMRGSEASRQGKVRVQLLVGLTKMVLMGEGGAHRLHTRTRLLLNKLTPDLCRAEMTTVRVNLETGVLAAGEPPTPRQQNLARLMISPT